VQRIGEILTAKGAVSPDGLRSALDACRRHGGRLGTWLVRLGYVSESVLLDALSQQTGCPPATALDLATAPAEIRALLPAQFAKRSLVVTFARQGRNVDVAMVNPNDLLLIDEITKLTGLVPRPHVATEAALAAALAIHVAAVGQTASAPPPGPPRAQVREWRQFWKLESSAQEVFKALETPAPAEIALAAATFPLLLPIGAVAPPEESVDADGLAEALSVATHRDQVADLVLAQAASLAPRVVLFSLHQGKVMGWEARGPAIVPEDFHTLILPLDRPSLFLNLSSGADIHVGPVGGGEGNDLLLDALGAPAPKEAVVLPIRVRGKLAGFLWLDRGEEGVSELPIQTARELARLTGLALEILVLRQKIKIGIRLTESGSGD
jgi:hypothetical protein